MGKPTSITPEELSWLKQAVADGRTYTSMARHIGVCSDTLKRILHRNNIVHFDGAKFAIKPPEKMWNRPCMRCKSTATRPKNLYFCDKCRPTSDDDEYSFLW